MKVKNVYVCMALLLFLGCLVSCERDFDIEIKNNVPQLVVEGYINNEFALYNYIILSKSRGFYEPGFQNDPVRGAVVTITEGEKLANNTIHWDETSVVALKEASLPQMGNQSIPGFYVDPRLLTTDSANALKGKPGKYYRLDMQVEGKKYSAVTTVLQPIPMDSLTSDFHYIDIDDDDTFHKARITVYYKDPDTIGNTQLYFWRRGSAQKNYGWGGLGMNEYVPGTDDQVNGQYIRLTQSYGFVVSDTVEMMMACVERNVYNFWDSFNKARNNNGPFSTPVTLATNISGEHVTGCFSGFGISVKATVVK